MEQDGIQFSSYWKKVLNERLHSQNSPYSYIYERAAVWPILCIIQKKKLVAFFFNEILIGLKQSVQYSRIPSFTKYDSLYILPKLIAIHSSDRTEIYMHRLSIGRKVYKTKKNNELPEIIMMQDSNSP